MPIVRFRRFSRPQTLKRIGRELLGRFFDQFHTDLEATNIALPGANLPDDAYFGSLARLLSSPEALPEGLSEALFAIDDLATASGQEQLERALLQGGRVIAFAPGSTREDIALQIWLADRALLARVHNRHRLLRLTAFEHFGTSLSPGQRPAFATPGAQALAGLATALDPWFALHQRGRNTTRIELYEFGDENPPGLPKRQNTHLPASGETCPGNSDAPGKTQPAACEYWFLVRHGDTFRRAAAVEAQDTEIIHFRPERDDVVIYSAAHDELRINARTRGERELYVKTFGQWLRGTEDYFSRASTYTLEPLRTDGPDALDATDLDGIERIVLREIQVASDHVSGVITTRLAEDLFECVPAALDGAEPIPRSGTLIRADFDLHFSGCPSPRPVRIRLPNILRLGRHCDTRQVDHWLCRRGFRLNA